MKDTDIAQQLYHQWHASLLDILTEIPQERDHMRVCRKSMSYKITNQAVSHFQFYKARQADEKEDFY